MHDGTVRACVHLYYNNDVMMMIGIHYYSGGSDLHEHKTFNPPSFSSVVALRLTLSNVASLYMF